MTAKEKEVIRKIIYAVETGGQVYGQMDYADFTEAYTNSSNETAITIGAGQWYGTEAQTLLNRIRKADSALFASLDTAGVASDLDNKDWSVYRILKTSAKAKCIVKIINSTVGRKCQDQLVDEQMEKYINEAAALNVTVMDAKMMCANFRHQGGYGAVTRILAKTQKPYTLDNLYAACQTDTGNQVGAYRSRQKMVYETLKKYISGTSGGGGNTGGNTGTASSNIQIAQRELNSKFNAGLTVDGSWGPASKKAYISAIQSALNSVYGAGLSVDGIWGSNTESACASHVLSQGANNLYVGVLQIGLYAHDISLSGAVDCDFGPSTKQGVITFQQRNGLSADGMAGRDTFKKLAEV
ncbi:MAG: peptidoglycan-binding protein [Eubacteriales bacterium]|nr:peptidoglycan-binding protein [Eubacteriales bacterium]